MVRKYLALSVFGCNKARDSKEERKSERSEGSMEKEWTERQREDLHLRAVALGKEDGEKTGYPSKDKPWLKFYSEDTMSLPFITGTVFESLHRMNKDYPEDIALLYFNRKITYRQLFENVQRTRDAFLRAGIRKGDKVILFTSATPETVYTVLALCRIGATANMINPLFTEEQIIDRVNETDATLLVVLDQLCDKIAGVVSRTCIQRMIVVPVYNAMPAALGLAARWKMRKDIPYDENVVSWNDFLKGAASDLPDAPYEKDRSLIMVYSSGTTGASKGIVLTNDGINATLTNYVRSDYLPHRRGEAMLQMIPVWFSTGIVLSILMPMCIGVTAILEPVFSKESFAKDIKKYKPNIALGATSLWLYAATCKELKGEDLSAMHYPITGGELLIPRVEVALNEFLASHGCSSPLLQGYGMCELGGTVTTASVRYPKLGSAGIPLLGVVVSAFDRETLKEQKCGTRGELCVASPCAMKEYFKNPEATERYFFTDENGTRWGRTGDMGYLDEDGYVYVLGRCGDCFTTSSGAVAYCFDIENVILQDACVAECEVVDLSTEQGKGVPVAQIVLSKGTDEAQSDLLPRLHSLCQSRLAADCVPQGYKIVDAFPVKNNGKRDMEAIRENRAGYMLPENGSLKEISF